MTQRLYTDLLKMARRRIKKASYILSYVNVSEPEDLVHGFVESPRYDKNASDVMIRNDFNQYCSIRVRDGKKRKEIGTIVTNSQNMTLDNVEEGYNADELIDGYIYRQSEMLRRVNPELSDASYRSVTGRLDYDAMLEDMQKEMCQNDRLFCVKNHKTGKAYQCGNPNAIPLVLMCGERGVA